MSFCNRMMSRTSSANIPAVPGRIEIGERSLGAVR